MPPHMTGFRCPECHGEGYHFEAILYRGLGGVEHSSCSYCLGYERVNILRYLYWYIIIIFWETFFLKLSKNIRRQ